MNEPTTATCAAAGAGLSVNLTGIATTCGLWISGAAMLLVFVLAALVMFSMSPPRSRREQAGMLAVAFAHGLMVGPLVIEYMGWTGWSFQAQLCVCFCVSAPGWLLWRIVSNQLARWRDAKNPIQSIAADVGSAKRNAFGLPDAGNIPPMPEVKPARRDRD
ncbi:MAG TPA: hypothetical protein VFW42_02105 [Fluviicoccus sp.]|nr:hypothetical protein [Fluviicoccus sp.]